MLILEILHVFLWLRFSSALNLSKADLTGPLSAREGLLSGKT